MRDYNLLNVMWMNDVRKGTFTAGEYLKKAVQRHEDDLEHAHERGLFYDAQRAHDACEFIERVCCHVKAEWAGKPFILSPFQIFMVSSLAGWLREDDTRRFRRAYVCVGRKFGKSLFASAMLAWLTYFDTPIEAGSEAYTAATTEQQARLVFDAFRMMVQKQGCLADVSTIKRKEVEIIPEPWFGSVVRPVGSDSTSKDGLNPHVVIIDELHEWKSYYRELYNKLTTGSGSRRQPMTVMITTAGSDASELWMEIDDQATRTLDNCADGEFVNDALFVGLCRTDAEDDTLDPLNWPKANPNMFEVYPDGIPEYAQALGTPKLSYLQEQADEAALDDAAKNRFDRYHANIRVSSLSKAIQTRWLAKCREPIDKTRWRKTFGGMDLARHWDLAAFVELGCLDDDDVPFDERRWEIVVNAYTCEEGDIDLQRNPWRTWVQDERITVEQGDAVDLDDVVQHIIQLNKEMRFREIAYDPFIAAHSAQQLMKAGLVMSEFHQRAGTYTEPMLSFINTIRQGRIQTGGCGLFEWSCGNLVLRHDRDNKVMPDRQESTDKIDVVVASIMAYGCAMFAKPQGNFHIFGG